MEVDCLEGWVHSQTPRRGSRAWSPGPSPPGRITYLRPDHPRVLVREESEQDQGPGWSPAWRPWASVPDTLYTAVPGSHVNRASAPALTPGTGRSLAAVMLGTPGLGKDLGSLVHTPQPSGLSTFRKWVSPQKGRPHPKRAQDPGGFLMKGNRGGDGAARPRRGAHPVPPPVSGGLWAPGQGLYWDLPAGANRCPQAGERRLSQLLTRIHESPRGPRGQGASPPLCEARSGVRGSGSAGPRGPGRPSLQKPVAAPG